MNITPELAKAVLIGEYKKLVYSDGIVIACFINQYELMIKCKEWLIKQGWNEFFVKYHNEKCYMEVMNKGNCIHYTADTELQAVIDACEWILENKDKQ